jgi:hypothetical protein
MPKLDFVFNNLCRNKAKYFGTIVRRSRNSGFSVKCGTVGKPFIGELEAVVQQKHPKGWQL